MRGGFVMVSRARWTGFVSGLVGVLVGALLVAAFPAGASNGDPMLLGKKNNALRITKLIGRRGMEIRAGRAGNPAINLYSQPGTPPMSVNRDVMVENLNADLLDGFDADGLIRVAFDDTNDANDADGDLVTASLTAPSDGYLVMAGSVDVDGSAFDFLLCELQVDGTKVDGSTMIVTVDTGVDQTNNSEENCSTTGAAEVADGPHDVTLTVAQRDGTTVFDNASVWALFVPFGGDGTPYVPAP
jgi:hypothetical protein